MTYKQLEEETNKWMAELEEQERNFLLQATQVNAWDRLVIENGEKVWADTWWAEVANVGVQTHTLASNLDLLTCLGFITH